MSDRSISELLSEEFTQEEKRYMNSSGSAPKYWLISFFGGLRVKAKPQEFIRLIKFSQGRMFFAVLTEVDTYSRGRRVDCGVGL